MFNQFDPFVNCKRCDGYGIGCNFPIHDTCPSTGYVTPGAFFNLTNSVPYIVDNSCDQYGPRLSYSEAVVTRFTRREDTSCINIAATFNMCDNSYTNSVVKQYLTQTIQNQYETLSGLLKVQKHLTNFVLYYHILDASNGTVLTSTGTVTCQYKKFHFTDVKDLFVTSYKNLYTIIIPAMSYDGLYTLVLDKIEAQVPYIDTQSVVTTVNPYYQFTDNNTRINLVHDAISTATTTNTVTIATLELNKTFPFQANLTTRLSLDFVAYTSTTIDVENAHEIWDALFDPIDAKIQKIKTDITNLDTRVTVLEKVKTSTYVQNSKYYTGEVVWLTAGKLFQATQDFTSDNTGSTAAASMAIDVAAGNLVAVSNDGETITALTTRVVNLEKLKTSTYVRNTAYYTGEIVWLTAGNLYQATQDFTSDNTDEKTASESMLIDITAGKLIAVSAADEEGL